LRFSPSAQIAALGPDLFLIDCGEGTQLKLRRGGFNFQRIGHIFISHLHGDHYLGLQGLLSTMQLLGRTKPVHIYAHPDLEELTQLHLRVSGSFLRFDIHWVPLTYTGKEMIADLDRVEVYSFPLDHRIPTSGFMICEKPKQRNIRPECIERFNIPVPRIRQIKAGADLTLEDGTVIPNKDLTREPDPLRSYAYCSDTAYSPATAAYIQGVDLLYHESTFLNDRADRAAKTHHSTASQAAQVAAEAGAGQLLLGHYSARYKDIDAFEDEAKAIFPESTAAFEGLTMPVGVVKK
jgi:ribonuclease Z